MISRNERRLTERSTSGNLGTFWKWTSKICFLPSMSGLGTTTCRSNLPGLTSALSRDSGKLVAATTITPSLGLNLWMKIESWQSDKKWKEKNLHGTSEWIAIWHTENIRSRQRSVMHRSYCKQTKQSESSCQLPDATHWLRMTCVLNQRPGCWTREKWLLSGDLVTCHA